MKSLLSVLLVLIMLLTFVGCSINIRWDDSPQEPTGPKYPAPTADSTIQTEEPTTPTVHKEIDDSKNPITMILSPVQEDEQAEDGTVTYFYRYQDVKIAMPESPDVQQIIQDSITELTKYTREQSRAAASWAKEMYTGEGEWTAHYTHVTFMPQRADQSVISFAAQILAFNGGSHPNSMIIPMNFNAETGQELKITEILTDEEYLNSVKHLVLSYLEDEFGKDKLMDGYEEVVDERFVTGSAESANWYLTDQGLVYYFAPYEIAAYRYGTVEVLLQYESLAGFIKEEFIPEKTLQQVNSIQAEISSQLETSFDAVHTVTLEPEGEHITLYGWENGSSIAISVGYWGIDDNLFYPTETVFYADNLSEQECVEILTYIPDTIPNVRIQIGGEGGQSLYLSQSGEDGSILLLKDNEF